MKQFVTLMFLFPFVSYAQQILTEEELVAAVKKFHPVAKAASVAVEAKKAGLLSSRGAFDPVIRWNHSQKNFEGIDYYNDNQTELKIPTWYGIDLYAGTENISGDKTNPEETKGKISYA
jgi:ABC-type molybdate transport system substrate-binding protein